MQYTAEHILIWILSMFIIAFLATELIFLIGKTLNKLLSLLVKKFPNLLLLPTDVAGLSNAKKLPTFDEKRVNQNDHC